MSTQVCWANLNPEASQRDAWDQGIVNELTAGDEFEHRGVDVFEVKSALSPKPLGTFYRPDWDRENGAVVVIPGQHNRDDEFVAPLCEFIAELPWALVIVTSDEEALFPVECLPHDDKHAIWGQYHARPEFDRVIPIGLPPNTESWFVHSDIDRGVREDEERPRDLDVFFAGQNTHSRREELIDVMKEMACEPGNGNISWVASTGFRAGLDRRDYLAAMSRTKIAPCPSGYHSLDSFRLYEAIAAGALPIIETNTPDGEESAFWREMFGTTDGFPIMWVDSWTDDFPQIVEMFHDDDELWRHQRDKVQRWWTAYRADLAADFAATIARLQS